MSHMKRHSSNDKFLLGIFITLLMCILAYSTCTKADICTVEMITKEAIRQHFDPAIAIAVATVESNLNMNVIGKSGEVGCFQVLPRIAPGEDLFNTEINIRIGIQHLKYWQRVCPTVEGISFVNCYNSGFRRPRYPFLRPYVRKVASAIRRQNGQF